MQFITLLDYLLLPFYLGIIYIIAVNFRNRYYPVGHPWRKYFMPALNVKIGGALFIGMVYQYYYGGGDTSYYFYQAKVVNKAMSDDFVKGIILMLHIPDWYEREYTMYISQMEWYGGLNMYTVIALTAFINLFTFQTFLPTSLFFAVFAFTGSWALFRTFAVQYPRLVRQVAIAVLFIPSCFIWGSGIFKDTLCAFALGWLTYGVFQVLVQRRIKVGAIIMSIVSFWILAVVKIYILLAFIPAMALWILFMYSHKIRSSFIRFSIKIVLAAATAAGFYLLSDKFAEELGGYSIDNISKTAEVTRSYIYGESGNDGSGYDLGTIDPSFLGMLKSFPLALGTTLYRPFLWEARKLLVFVNAIEATLFLWLSVKIIITVGIRRIYKIISSDPNIQFFLVFTVIFGFAVGLTSGNFGSLSRYRIPCLPMFALSLFLIYYNKFPAEKKILPPLGF